MATALLSVQEGRSLALEEDFDFQYLMTVFV